MAPASDTKPTQPSKVTQPNIQDVFLNYVRREKLSVTIRMMDGTELEGRIKNFDRFALVLDHGGTDHMIFKHAIAAIKTPRPVSNYFSHQ
jgi:host factor-I protein